MSWAHRPPTICPANRYCCCGCRCLLVHRREYSWLQERAAKDAWAALGTETANNLSGKQQLLLWLLLPAGAPTNMQLLAGTCCQYNIVPYLVNCVHSLTVHQDLHSSIQHARLKHGGCWFLSCVRRHVKHVSGIGKASCMLCRKLHAVLLLHPAAMRILSCSELRTPTVLHLRPSGPVMLMGADQIQMPRVQDWCVGDTTKPLGLSTLVNLLSIWFSRKLLPCLARPHTDTVQRGPGMVCRTRMASCPTSQLLLASLKPISSSGLPCAACALLGSAAAGVLVLLNQLEAMMSSLWTALGYAVVPKVCCRSVLWWSNNSPWL
jgi:hypothetical protein